MRNNAIITRRKSPGCKFGKTNVRRYDLGWQAILISTSIGGRFKGGIDITARPAIIIFCGKSQFMAMGLVYTLMAGVSQRKLYLRIPSILTEAPDKPFCASRSGNNKDQQAEDDKYPIIRLA